MPATRKFRIPEGILPRAFGTETIILHLKKSKYYSLDPVGGRLLELLGQGEDLDHVVNQMLSEYDVVPEDLKVDMEGLCGELEAEGLIEEVKD